MPTSLGIPPEAGIDSIGLTVFAILLVLFVLVNPPKEEKGAPPPANTPKVAKRLLITTAVASCFDSGGDVGTQMARSTILIGLFPAWGTPGNNNILLLVVIGVAIGAFILLALFKKMGFNLAMTATLGAFATLLTQVRVISRAPPPTSLTFSELR